MYSKQQLDKLVKEYETKEFIKNDPIQFPHKFKNKKDVEIAGFLASLFSYGSRKVFIKKLDELFLDMDYEPLNYITNNDFSKLEYNNFNYRFSKCFEIIEVLKILSKLYNNSEGLEELFKYGYENNHNLWDMFQSVVNYFYSNKTCEVGQGFYHLLPNPCNNCAMKRMNMLMRWFIRKSSVDLGIWNFMDKKNLYIPLDVHVARTSREMGLLQRKSNDKYAVIELTQNLKQYDKDDPIKYDFVFFGAGIENTKISN